MKGLYIFYSFILVANVLLFAQRALNWTCKALEGKRIIKHMRPSNTRYKAIYGLYTKAKTNAACWLLVDAVSICLFFDCMVQVFKG